VETGPVEHLLVATSRSLAAPHPRLVQLEAFLSEVGLLPLTLRLAGRFFLKLEERHLTQPLLVPISFSGVVNLARHPARVGAFSFLLAFRQPLVRAALM
jgi:hypothetical protein